MRQVPPSYVLLDALCGLCGQSKATLTHVLALCPFSLGSMENDFNRITWRHNGILKELITSIRGICRDRGFSIMADLPGSPYHYDRFPSHLANTEQRPDLLLINDQAKKVIKGELTSPMQSNLDYQNKRKNTPTLPNRYTRSIIKWI